MRNLAIDTYLITEDSNVMEDCLYELPPFGSFPMRGFNRKFRSDFFLDELTTETPSRPALKVVS